MAPKLNLERAPRAAVRPSTDSQLRVRQDASVVVPTSNDPPFWRLLGISLATLLAGTWAVGTWWPSAPPYSWLPALMVSLTGAQLWRRRAAARRNDDDGLP